MSRAPALPLATLAACAAALALLSAPPGKPRRDEHLAPLLPRLEFLRAVGSGHIPLLADYYWIQTIQAAGVARTPEEYLDIYHYANLLTDLDPDFKYAYLFAGSTIPTNLGREQWVNTRESTRIIEKGRQRFPKIIELGLLYAYNLSFFHHEYAKAAQVLEETSRIPGSPAYITPLATRLYAQAGKVDAGLALARSMAESATDEGTRALFEQRVRELELEKVLQSVDRASATFKAREDRAPRGLWELVGKGDLPVLPFDPLGGTISIGEDGLAYSTAATRRLKIYTPEDR